MMGIFEFLYYFVYSAKKHYSLQNQKQLPCRVISIGNITLGGTGKTPATIAIAEEAKRRGFRPVILTRGYKGRANGPCLVSYQLSAISYQLYGDEPVLMAERLKDVPVVKCADRYKGGVFALQNLGDTETRRHGGAETDLFIHSPFHPFTPSPILFILDDGYQHWRLFRDKDILLVDGENPFYNRRLLPVGPLREPLKEIKWADIIVITKAVSSQKSEVESLIEEIREYNTRAQIFLAGHRLSQFIKPSGETMPIEWAEGKNFFAFCGIGNPESFKKTILSAGCILKGLKTYRDHYTYRQQDIENILAMTQKNNADWLVTTEKDMVRLKGLNLPENLIAIAIEFAPQEGFYDEAFRL